MYNPQGKDTPHNTLNIATYNNSYTRGKLESLQVWFYELVEDILVSMPVGVVYTRLGVHVYLASRIQSFKTEGVVDIILLLYRHNNHMIMYYTTIIRSLVNKQKVQIVAKHCAVSAIYTVKLVYFVSHSL